MLVMTSASASALCSCNPTATSATSAICLHVQASYSAEQNDNEQASQACLHACAATQYHVHCHLVIKLNSYWKFCLEMYACLYHAYGGASQLRLPL